MNLTDKLTDLPTGMTFINKDKDGDFNIQYTNSDTMTDIYIEIKEFLLASGFAKSTIDEYFEEY